MMAVVNTRYGPPEVLELTRVPVPAPGPGQVLVRVEAVALNPADKFLVLGRPTLVRLVIGLRRPSAGNRVRGQDLAGTVVAVGAGVTNSGEEGPDGGPIVRILKAVLLSMTSRQTVRTFTSAPNVADLETLASMAEAGTIRPFIDQVYPLERAAEAMAHVASRHARGKVVVRVAPDDAART